MKWRLGLLAMLSQTSIQDYADCARRFKLKYMDMLKYPAIESEPVLENERKQQEGQFFHRLVQQYLLGLDKEMLGRLAGGPNLDRWWQNFLEQAPAFEGCTIFTEYTLSAQLSGLRLVAKYDLIVIENSRATIYDWKTSQKRTGTEFLAARWQTRVYMALLAHSGGFLIGEKSLDPANVQMVYWFPDFPAEPAIFTYDQEHYQRDWNALQSLASEIPHAADYPQTEDTAKCRYCTYRSYCDRGISAPQAGDREQEAALVTSLNLDFEQIGEIAF